MHKSKIFSGHTLKILCSTFTLSAVLLCGCQQSATEDSQSSSLPEPEVMEHHDLATEKWLAYEEIETPEVSWAVTEYMDDLFSSPGPEFKTQERCFAAWQDHCYNLCRYTSGSDAAPENSYYLHSVDTVTLETSSTRLELTDGQVFPFDAERETLYPVSLDASEGRLCAFLKSWDIEAQDYAHYYAFRLTPEGALESVLDLLPAIRECNTDQDDGFFPTVSVSDPKGYYYLIDESRGEILIVDQSGQSSGMVLLPDYGGGNISVPFKSADGTPFFEYGSKDGQTFFLLTGGTEQKILFDGEVPSSGSRTTDENGNIYFLSGKQLLRWNAALGTCTCLCDTDGLDEWDCNGLLRNSLGDLVLICGQRADSYLFKLKAAPDFEPKELVLLQWHRDEYTKSCAEEYNRTHPGIRIRVETPEDTSDVSFARMTEELKSGDGPDLIVTDRQHLKTLAEVGLLAEPGLPEELQQQIFDGVLSYGRINGTLYGVPYEASLETLLVSSKIWEQDSWTAQDIMNLMAENPSLKRCIAVYYSQTSDNLLYNLVARNLEGSPYVNFTESTCSFKGKDFSALLRFCREYEEPSGSVNLTDAELRDQVLKEEALSFSLEGGFKGFSQGRAMFGEYYHCVGYPDASENGSLITCYSCAAISGQTAYPDIARDFMQFLLSEKCQANYTVSWVRRDVLTEHVREHTGITEGPAFFIDEDTIIPLEGRPDGTSYLEEYLSLMEHGKAACTEYELIDMLMEEASMFFEGDRDETDTAGVLQSRIGLYLEERK